MTKTRSLSVLLALSLLIGVFVVIPASPVRAEDTIEYNGIVFEPFPDRLKAGGDLTYDSSVNTTTIESIDYTTYNFYLTESLGLEKAINVVGNSNHQSVILNLCLNGYDIAPKAGKSITSAITTGYYVIVNIYDNDTNEDSGCIKGVQNKSNDSAAIKVDPECTLNMYGGTICDCTSTGEAGAVDVVGKKSGYIKRGVFNMYDGAVIKNCTAVSKGAGVKVTNYSIFNMYGGEIKDCTVTGSHPAGGVSLDTGSTMNMYGGTITGNSAKSDGCGIYVSENATFNVSGSPQIYGNTISEGVENNVNTGTNRMINVDQLDSGAQIGVTPNSNNGYVFANVSGSENMDSFYFDNPGSTKYIVKVEDGVAKFIEDNVSVEGLTLILNEGRIGVNYYVSGVDSSATMSFTVMGAEQSSVATYDQSRDMYYFTCLVNAPEMTETITPVLTYNSATYHFKATSVKAYGEYVLSNPGSFPGAEDLVRKLLSYGAYSQKLFNVNTDDLAYDVPDTCTDSVAQFSAVSSATPLNDIDIEGLTYVGASLVLKSETTFKLYFKVDSGHSISEYTLSDGYTFEQNGNYYCIRIADIDVTKLLEPIEFSISGTDVVYSPQIYIYNNKDSSNADLANTLRALYLYSVAASDYQG
ncbi:MAG: hypothetical protein J6U23_03575 [Clostridiales bacterium]|nr:hypothetical protein [Clostridiales bacterium]